MSVYEAISVLISTAALFGVIVSLWFVRRQVAAMGEQTRHLAKALDTSAEVALDGLFICVTQIYVQHPELRPIFNEREADGGVEPMTAETRYRANALAETLLDAIERALHFETRELPDSANLLRAWITDSFRHSAFLRDWLDRNAAWYSPRLIDILQGVRAEMAAVSP